MRPSPSFQVALRRFGIWRGVVAALAALGCVAMFMWLLGRDPRVPLEAASVALGALATVGLAVSLGRVDAADLRWDGRCWHLNQPAAPQGEPVPGNLQVAMDLGPWMLLRFMAIAPASGARVVWLPVQRRGIEAQWHALRCAVHSPQPARAEPAGDGTHL